MSFVPNFTAKIPKTKGKNNVILDNVVVLEEFLAVFRTRINNERKVSVTRQPKLLTLQLLKFPRLRPWQYVLMIHTVSAQIERRRSIKFQEFQAAHNGHF